jgi:hypothetical protein
MRVQVFFALVLLASVPSTAQQSFYSHDNYTQYELLEPGSAQFAITYFVTERRAGSVFLINQTRSGSAGSDISVFDPQTGKPLKFDYLSGEEMTKDGTPGRFDPAEHYIRARLPRPVPEGGEGRVKILKTYKDEKSYFLENEDVVFKRSLGIARNSIVLPKGYRLVSSNVAAQMFTLPDGRLKISFEHAHGYAADVTIRGRKSGSAATAAAIPLERSFDFSKSLFDLGPPDAHAFKVTHEYLEERQGARAALPEGIDQAPDALVTDVDTGQSLPIQRQGKKASVALIVPITTTAQSARLRITGTVTDPKYRVDGQTLLWDCTIAEPRSVVLLPAGWDVAAVSVPATSATQPDGRVAIQIYNGTTVPLPVTIRAHRR